MKEIIDNAVNYFLAVEAASMRVNRCIEAGRLIGTWPLQTAMGHLQHLANADIPFALNDTAKEYAPRRVWEDLQEILEVYGRATALMVDGRWAGTRHEQNVTTTLADVSKRVVSLAEICRDLAALWRSVL